MITKWARCGATSTADSACMYIYGLPQLVKVFKNQKQKRLLCLQVNPDISYKKAEQF